MISFHLRPRQINPNFVKTIVDQISEENEKIEPISINGFIFIIVIKTLCKFEFIRKLVKKYHDDEKSQKSTEETTNIGKGIIDFFEGSLNQYILARFPKVQFDIILIQNLIIMDLS